MQITLAVYHAFIIAASLQFLLQFILSYYSVNFKLRESHSSNGFHLNTLQKMIISIQLL